MVYKRFAGIHDRRLVGIGIDEDNPSLFPAFCVAAAGLAVGTGADHRIVATFNRFGPRQMSGPNQAVLLSAAG